MDKILTFLEKKLFLKFGYLIFTAIFMAIASHSYGDEGDPVSPLTEFQFPGISLTIPDEDGWLEFNPKNKDITGFVKDGPNIKSESYVISVEIYNSTGLRSEEELLELVKNQSTGGSRLKFLVSDAELDRSRGVYFVKSYMLAEDHGAHQMPKDESFALLEAMSFNALHPYDPDALVSVSYSHRYYPGYEDPGFRNKAKWLLDHAVFTKP